MTVPELHERGAGRVLPAPAEETTTISGYVAHLSLDADRRTRLRHMREIAARLIVVAREDGAV